MAVNRKYADLPDLDSAPDIYETPDLTDDNSTIPTTIDRSPSDNEFDDDDDNTDTEDGPGISRSRLRIDQARSRFMPSQVDARDVDFSDRVNGKRKSYRASARRHHILDDGTVEIGDWSDGEEGESLEGKLARLKREIQEAKEEYGKQKAESEDTAPEHGTELVTLSHALEELSMQSEEVVGRRAQPARAEREPAKSQDGVPPASGDATYTVTYAPSYDESHALAQAADFDWRLSLLEKAIGISSTAEPGLEGVGLPRAIIPTLETLQTQISTLSEASTSSLDSISRRVRTLTQEAEQLEKSRKAAKAAQEELSSAGGSTVETDDAEQVAKINALYGTLPAIESLGPLLPPLLDRLRSLRAIHADAATASDTLQRIERNQSEMASDIRQWREGLGKIEEAIEAGETSMSGNMKVIEGWVKELEVKMAHLT
ncbi:Dynamitin-domain-containing protein [Astrocystis sublimbata]|nr:Dynamitin-domain-containing protein [Astrocystis sublimbata]